MYDLTDYTFLCIHIHTSSLASIIFILDFITIILQFYPEVTLFVVKTILFVSKASQVVPCKTIQLFLILHDVFKIQAYTIDYYCYRHHYFALCELQVIRFIVSSIKWTIVRNTEVSEFVCFYWLQSLYDLTHYIFLMHSNSSFITHIHCFVD